jgi:hypothetical protein
MKGLNARFGCGLFILVMLAGNSAAAQPAAGGQTPPPPRNLQILKPQEVGPAMRSFTFALGVQCNYCHVTEPTRDFASDDKQTKKTARVMLQMVTHVNEMLASGVGKPAADVSKVQCATCHRGKAIPETPETPPPPAAQTPGRQ